MADDNSAFVLQPLTNESAFSEPLRIKCHFFLPQDYLSDFFSSFSSSRKVSRSLNSR